MRSDWWRSDDMTHPVVSSKRLLENNRRQTLIYAPIALSISPASGQVKKDRADNASGSALANSD